MKIFLNTIFLILVSLQVFAQQIPTTVSQQASFQNLLPNAGFENGKSGWTCSGGSFNIVNSSFVDKTLGSNSASFLPSASGQYCESSLVNVPVGQDCMAKIAWNGSDSNVYLTVFDGSNNELTPGQSRFTFSSQTVRKNAKIYFSCPLTGKMKLRIQSSAAGAIGYFDNAYLGESDQGTVGINTSEQPYTPIFSGLTVSSSEFFWFQRADKIVIRGKFTVSGTASSPARISLPNSYLIDPIKIPSTRDVGRGTRSTTPDSDIVLIAEPSSTSLSFGSVNSPSFYPLYKVDGTFAAPGDVVTVSAEVPIQGLAASDTVINAKCPNDIACENVFTAKGSSSGIISSENLDFINGNCTTTSPFVCTFNSGVFNTAPNCTASGILASTGAAVTAVSPTSVTVQVFNTSTSANYSGDFYLSCQKTGIDFKAKQNIQGFLSAVNTNSGNGIARDFWISFGGSGTNFSPTVCTSTPCTIYKQDGAATSVARVGVGTYNVNLASGTFSEVHTCDSTYSYYYGAITCNCNLGSNTSATVSCFNTTNGSNADGSIFLSIKGYR